MNFEPDIKISAELAASNPSLVAAVDYIRKGLHVVEVGHKEKKPLRKNWQTVPLTEDQAREIYGQGNANIGLALGERSLSIIDIDFDCEEARQLAPSFLPRTDAIFGRLNNPSSHWLYRCSDAPPPTTQFKEDSRDPDGKRKSKMLLELRSTGAQTVIPPSVHVSGEEIEWERDGEPALVTSANIVAACNDLACATLFARAWPEDGRHEAALTASGTLARAGWNAERIETLIRGVCECAGDPKIEDRIATIKYAIDRVANGAPTFGFPKLAQTFGKELAEKVWQLLGLALEKQPSTGRDRVLSVAADMTLWRTPDDTTCATIRRTDPIGGEYLEHIKLRSRTFKKHLAALTRRETGKSPTAKDIDEALLSLDAEASTGPVYSAAVRVAGHDGKLYIDLGDAQWHAVEIDAEGYRVIANPPVKFLRSRGMLPLPWPEAGGTIDGLREFVNLASEEDFRLFAGAMLAALSPIGPYPVLMLIGEQGTAKTTMAKLYRNIVDPNVAPTRSMPSSEQDLYIGSQNSWAQCFDNLSGLRGSMADALCRIATGGGFSTRELYTNDDEVLIQVTRPVMINGIPLASERPDLLDRSIVIILPVIAPNRRRTEREFWASFTKAHPKIFGALLTALSAAIRNADRVHIEEMPRMADFAKFMAAAEEGFGWEPGSFLEAYMDSHTRSMTDVAGNDPIVVAISEALTSGGPIIDTTATKLLQKLNNFVGHQRPHGWPRQPNHLTKALRRLAPAMRKMGFKVELDRVRDGNNVKLISISRAADEEEPF
jgi:hypothetical protein